MVLSIFFSHKSITPWPTEKLKEPTFEPFYYLYPILTNPAKWRPSECHLWISTQGMVWKSSERPRLILSSSSHFFQFLAHHVSVCCSSSLLFNANDMSRDTNFHGTVVAFYPTGCSIIPVGERYLQSWKNISFSSARTYQVHKFNGFRLKQKSANRL